MEEKFEVENAARPHSFVNQTIQKTYNFIASKINKPFDLMADMSYVKTFSQIWSSFLITMV